MIGEHISVNELAQRWKRRPEWITSQARDGAIPGAWKSGHLWRFFLPEVEAYEISRRSESVFELSDQTKRRMKRD